MGTKANLNLKKIIIDHKKLDPTVRALFTAKFGDGFDDDEIINFRTANGELVECLEVRTEDTIYLVKMGKYSPTSGNVDPLDQDEDNQYDGDD
ncbi:hypothetical protein [Sediminicola luteus]|uniref:Uncharacterized protein n=1 Tax=Sediminicola luteus TaxID=319238 RepID=A0A2A4G3I2_9FLAO|nr:hypothetical protein [Sediminicola luteus]PCE62991.1 hypothetical protein B7P33_17090 [Sediminicola luteus]